MTDLINHPPHYRGAGGLEAIEVIERYGLGYHLGNAIKYLLRAGKKGELQGDLEKARWYLRRWVDLYIANKADEPMADEEALAWRDPAEIADAFALSGPQRWAAVRVLEAAVFEYDDLGSGEMILEAIDRLDRAIAQCGAEAAPHAQEGGR